MQRTVEDSVTRRSHAVCAELEYYCYNSIWTWPASFNHFFVVCVHQFYFHVISSFYVLFCVTAT